MFGRAEDDARDLPPTVAARIDEACDRFEADWAAGRRPRIEQVLEAEPGPWRPELLRHLLAVELAYRRRAGEVPEPEEYRRRFPEHAAPIDRAFEREAALARPRGPGPPFTAIRLQGPAGPGVLDTIALSIGLVPRVLLRDTAPGEAPGPIVRPNGNSAEAGIRYRIDGEIARGGMGTILKGRDPDLGRDVALKVLREDLRADAELVRRFVEEAQIGGQLLHPGVVPIYELGTLADRRPFFAMKLVKGHTLAQILALRHGPASELPRFLSIFEAVCQTVAYAHARGVIHRDLKPSNVMVGSFGEVQVMDWGLAKVLTRGGAVDDAGAGRTREETVIATARSGEADSDLSHPGSAMGTPSYMAPEQARGEIDRIDERADVFALGSILCEVLTSRPAFIGRTSGEIQSKAARGDLADSLARLDASGADAELVALAKVCLSPEVEDRPCTAGVVAEQVTSYLAGVREKLRRAELERVEAQATAVELRKRRRVELSLAAAVLTLVVVGGGSAAALIYQRQARAFQVEQGLREALVLRDQALRKDYDPVRWARAVVAAQQVADEARDGDGDVPRKAAALRAEVERDNTLLAALVVISDDATSDPDGFATDTAYAAAFRAAGIDVVQLPPDEAGARIKECPEQIAQAMATALDDWAALRRGRRHDPGGARRLAEVANAADPHDWRMRLRAALGHSRHQKRLEALQELRRTVQEDELTATSLGLLGAGLADAGDREGAEELLRRAQLRHPSEVRLHHELARVLEALARPEMAIAHYTAARALRPDAAHPLAHALNRHDRTDDAIDVFQELIARRPMNGIHAVCLTDLLRLRGRPRDAEKVIDKAIAANRQAIVERPGDARAHQALGLALWSKGKNDDAIAEFLKTIDLTPDETAPHIHIARILGLLGRYRDAVKEVREAIDLSPDDAGAWTMLGVALATTDQANLAAAAFEKALELGSDSWQLHMGRGGLFMQRGLWREGADAYESARENSSRSLDDEQLWGRPGHRQGIDNSTTWYFSAFAQLRAGRIERYHSLCREMLQRYGDNFGAEAERVARTCLVAPDEPGVIAKAARLAERALKDLPGDPYTLYTAGLADYRSGRDPSALERVGRSRKANETGGIILFRDTYRALTDLVEAMAQMRLGRTGPAREALARAERRMADRMPAKGAVGLYPFTWQEWFHCEVIHREAEAVVRWDPIFPADPFAH